MFLIIAIGWFIFWLYWIVAAIQTGIENPYVKKEIISWHRIVVLLVAMVVVLLAHTAYLHLSTRFTMYSTHNLLTGAIGVIVFISGLLVAVWARKYMGKNWGMPVTLRENVKLVTTGPYQYVRHPIYLGLLLGLFGTTLVMGLWWLLVFVTVYLIYCSVKEEQLLGKQFPDDYPNYKATTKMLIPFIF